MNNVYNFDSSSTEKFVPVEDACCDVNITRNITANKYSTLVFPFDITSKEQFESNFGTTKYSIVEAYFATSTKSAFQHFIEKEDFPILAGTPIRVYVKKDITTISFTDVHLYSELPQYTLVNSGAWKGYIDGVYWDKEGDYLKQHWIIENYWHKHLVGDGAAGVNSSSGNIVRANGTAQQNAFAWKLDVIEKYVNEGAELRPYLKYYIANNNLYLKDNGSILNIFGVTQKTYIDETTPVRVYTDNTYTPYNFGNVIKVNKPEFVVYTKSENPQLFAEFEKQFTPEYEDGITTRELDNYITFEDSNVKSVITTKFGTDGEITFKQAAQVTNEQLEGLFNGNTTITKFNEFVFFTGITQIGINTDTTAAKNTAPFRGSYITEITLPHTIRKIGVRAFDQTPYLGRVKNIGLAKEFDLCCFQSSGVNANNVFNDETITVENMGLCPFSNCVYIYKVIFAEGIENLKERCLLLKETDYAKSLLTSVTLPSTLKVIETNAFQYAPLKKIIIPSNVTTIGESAFIYSKIEEIDIPNTVVSIGQYAFKHTPLKGLFKYPENPHLTAIPYQCFSDTQIETFVVPKYINNIGVDAFKDCAKLKVLYVNNTTPPTITNTSFSNCPLEKIYVPKESVEAYKAANIWSGFADRIFGI